MSGDELCALLGSYYESPEVKRALKLCSAVEIEDDDGFAESKRGFRLEIVTGFVSTVEFDRRSFKESLPAEVIWDATPTHLEQVGTSPQGEPVYETGRYQLVLVRRKGAPTALIAAEALARR